MVFKRNEDYWIRDKKSKTGLDWIKLYEIKFLNTIKIIDNFISDNELVSWLKDESKINGTVERTRYT